MSRPPGVPDDFVCVECSQCGRPTWYPPAAAEEAARLGMKFLVACERQTCLQGAVKQMQGGGAGYSGTSTERIEAAQAKYPHKNPVDALWDQAALQPGSVIDIGRLVACDDCGTDYTDSPECGGFIWHSRATCPRCAARVMQLPTQKLERLMKDGQHCPIDTSFADFVRAARTDSTIKVNPPKGATDADG